MIATIVTTTANGPSMLPAPGGLLPWAGAAVLLIAGLIWQWRRVRERTADLSDRQERVMGLEASCVFRPACTVFTTSITC